MLPYTIRNHNLAQELATGIGVQQIIGAPDVLHKEIEAFEQASKEPAGPRGLFSRAHKGLHWPPRRLDRRKLCLGLRCGIAY